MDCMVEPGLGFKLESRGSVCVYANHGGLAPCTSSIRPKKETVGWWKKISGCSRDDIQYEKSSSSSGLRRAVAFKWSPRMLAGFEEGTTAETVRTLCRQGQLREAVEALGRVSRTDCGTSKTLFYTVLKGCLANHDLVLGRRLHALLVKMGYESDTFLCNHILRMYASQSRLQEAMDVFTVVAEPDAFTWSAVISACAQHGQARRAVQLYHQMRRSSVKPDRHVFVAALQACARAADLATGQQVHADVLASGLLHTDSPVCSCLVDMYAKCGSLEDAQRVFDGLSQKNAATWNAVISGYSQQGLGQKALQLYSAMQQDPIAAPTHVTFVCVLQACASLGTLALERGRQLHVEIVELGLEADVVVGCSLVNMYVKCGSLNDAQCVFDGLGQKNVVTWTALIAGYSQQKGMGEEALRLYSAMQEEGIAAPDSVTFVCLLQACASVGTPALEKGRALHAHIRKQGLQADVVVGCSLVNMYAKCGSLEDAHQVFDRLPGKDVVTWTALIAGYSQQGMGQEALRLYSAMQQQGIAVPDSVTFVCLLQACASVGIPAMEKGKQLHSQMRERGLHADGLLGNSLVNMYAKCGSVEDAQALFEGLTQKTVATWNSMIAGYSQQGMGQAALHLYRVMQQEGILAPDYVTYVCLLQACANVAALHLGRQLHAEIEEHGLQADVLIAIGLINMYAKSGSMVDAQQIFEALPEKNFVAWNTLIAGYTRQGDSDRVFDLFHQMRENCAEPAGITFLSVLTACSHAGLVNKGREYFQAMSRHYGLVPTAEHYTCMVDLLGRAGQLEEALALVRTMPVLPDAAVWRTLLSACRKWSSVELACHAFHEAVKLDKKDPSAYVLMSNIYTAAQMWEEAQEMQQMRKGVGAWKQPGQSWWTGVDGLVHSFSVGDEDHPESEAIYASLMQLYSRLKKAGYALHLDLSSVADFSYEEMDAPLCVNRHN